MSSASSQPGFSSLLERARAGDPRSLRWLMREFRSEVTCQCRLIDLDDPELSVSDLVQEAWMRIWCSLDQFRGDADDLICLAMFRKWIRLTSRRVALNVLAGDRAQKRRPLGGLQRLGNVEPTELVRPAGETPSGIVAAREERERLHGALRQLSDTCRSVVTLHFLDQLSLRQIAERLSLSYDRTRREFHAGLSELERLMNGTTRRRNG